MRTLVRFSQWTQMPCTPGTGFPDFDTLDGNHFACCLHDFADQFEICDLVVQARKDVFARIAHVHLYVGQPQSSVHELEAAPPRPVSEAERDLPLRCEDACSRLVGEFRNLARDDNGRGDGRSGSLEGVVG